MSQDMTSMNDASPRSGPSTAPSAERSPVRSAMRGKPFAAQAQMLTPRESRRAHAPVQRTAAKESESGDAAIASAEGMARSVGGEGAADTSPWGKGAPAEPSGKSYFDYDPFADLNQIGQGPDTVPQGPDNQVGAPGGTAAGDTATGGAKAQGAGQPGAGGQQRPKGKPQGGGARDTGTSESQGAAPSDETPTDEVAPPENPDVHLDTGGATHVRPAFVSVGGKVKGQFAMKRELKRDLKYATLDAVTFKVDFEASVPGQAGTVTYGGKSESKGGTTKDKKQTELSVPLGEIKPDFGGGELKVAAKGGWEHNEDKATAVTSAEVTWGWCVGEIKIELFGLDSDKGLVPPRVKCSAGGKYSKDHIVQGYKMNLTGKCTVEAEVTPNYVEIGKAFGRVVSRVTGGPATAAGAGAAGGAGATAAAGEAAAETGVAAVGTGELLFAAGLLTIPATMVYALYRDAGDIREMKAAGERADTAAKEFIAGYLSPFGIGKVAGEFGPQGEAAGKKQIIARLDAMERKYEASRKADTAKHGYDRFGPFTPKDRDEGYERIKERVKEHAAIFKEGANGAFYSFVRSEIYRAWRREKELKDGSVPADQDERVRLYVLGSKAPVDKPQWDKFDTAWRTMGFDG